MTRFEFTARALIAALVVAGLGAAALILAGPLSRWIVMVATIVVLTAALLRALMRGREAAFSVGFAATGWIWLALALKGFLYFQHPQNLPVKYLAEERYEIFWRDDVAYVPPPPEFAFGRPERIAEAIAVYEIGELLTILGAAFCGGLFTTYLAAAKTRRQGREETTEPASPE